MKPNFLLALADEELLVVADALTMFATDAERDGDPCGYAPIADRVHDRVQTLRPLVMESAVQWLKACGLGSYRDRPQG